jgi:hypothetical protein
MILRIAVIAFLYITLTSFAETKEIKQASVEELNGTVNIRRKNEEKAAALHEIISGRDAIKTGTSSRAELKFWDKSFARLGSNTIFSFDPEHRNLLIRQGTGLFVVPKGLGGTTISSPSATAGILGTTVYLNVSRDVTEYYCLEGKCQIGPHVLNPGDRITIPQRGSYSAPIRSFDAKEFLQTNELVLGFKKPLASKELILKAAEKTQ